MIRRLLESGPQRRQAAYLLLSRAVSRERHLQLVNDGSDAPGTVLRAETLRDGRAQDMVAMATGGPPPEGLLGALARLGLRHLPDPALYRRLAEVFLDAEQHRVAEALRYVGEITPTMLRIIDILPADLVGPATLTRLRSVADATGFVEAMQFVQRVNSVATSTAIREAAAGLPEGSDLNVLIGRFLRRADLALPHPLVADSEVEPLVTVREMILAARRLRNCLGSDTKIVGALLGRRAYALFKSDYIVEFLRLTDGSWLFLDCHAPRNGQIPADIEDAVRGKMAALKVPCLPGVNQWQNHFHHFVVPIDSTLLHIAA